MLTTNTFGASSGRSRSQAASRSTRTIAINSSAMMPMAKAASCTMLLAARRSSPATLRRFLGPASRRTPAIISRPNSPNTDSITTTPSTTMPESSQSRESSSTTA